MKTPSLLALLVIPATGCVIDEPNESIDEVQAAPIRGTFIDRHHLTDGTKRLHPIDLRGVPIVAQVERGTGFEVHAGVGTSAGTFAIEGVGRNARYWLGIGINWYLTKVRQPELGRERLGRADITNAEAGTSLVLDVGGLVPVGDSDDFQLQSANAGMGFYSTLGLFNPITANAPAPGDTALAGAEFPFDADAALGTSQFPLVEATRGDSLTVSQLSLRFDGSVAYWSLARALTTSVTMTQGGATALTGTLTAPPTGSTSFDFRQTAFEAFADAIAPGTVADVSSVFVDANQLGRSVVAGTPDLAYTNLDPGTSDQVMPFTYGNPFPASWPRFGASSTLYLMPYRGPAADGSTVVRRAFVTAFSQRPIEGPGVRLEPLVTPPLDVAIDGAPLSDAVQPTGLTPTVEWSAPALGTPRNYIVRVHQLNVAVPRRVTVARLIVDGDTHRVRIPAGILQRGLYYHVSVTAQTTGEPIREERLEPVSELPSGAAVARSTTIRVDL